MINSIRCWLSYVCIYHTTKPKFLHKYITNFTFMYCTRNYSCLGLDVNRVNSFKTLHAMSTFFISLFFNPSLISPTDKLVAPIHQGSGGAGLKEHGGTVSGSVGGGAMSSLRAGLRRSGSQGSLNSLLSVVDSIKTEQHFRVCAHCMAVSTKPYCFPSPP